jgi:hypothetical protein
MRFERLVPFARVLLALAPGVETLPAGAAVEIEVLPGRGA